MSIETRLSDQELNIKDLSLEQPESNPNLAFDPERDISQEDKQKVLTELQRLSSGTDIAMSFADMAVNAKILFPKDYDQMKVGSTELNVLRSRYIHVRTSAEFNTHDFGRWSALANDAANLKILFPEHQDVLRLDEKLFEDFNNVLDQQIIGTQPITSNNLLFDYIFDITILYPEKTKNLQWPEWLLERLKSDIQWCKDNKKFGDNLAHAAFYGRLLFPDKFAALTLEQEDWQLMNQGLKEKSQKNFPIDYAHMAMKMKLLAMEDLRITDKGFEYSIPENNFKAPAAAIPKIKRF